MSEVKYKELIEVIIGTTKYTHVEGNDYVFKYTAMKDRSWLWLGTYKLKDIRESHKEHGLLLDVLDDKLKEVK